VLIHPVLRAGDEVHSMCGQELCCTPLKWRLRLTDMMTKMQVHVPHHRFGVLMHATVHICTSCPFISPQHCTVLFSAPPQSRVDSYMQIRRSCFLATSTQALRQIACTRCVP
jgi:hypothetical protein